MSKLLLLQRRFEAENGVRISVIYNETYAERLEGLQAKANKETSSHDEPAFRFLQLLEHTQN